MCIVNHTTKPAGCIKDFRPLDRELFENQLIFKKSFSGIKLLKSDSFVDLKNLKELEIKSKFIDNIEIFENLKHLRTLALKVEDQRCTLSKNTFDYLTELENLSLNKFSFESGIINSLLKLKIIRFIECLIEDSDLFCFNSELEALTLDGNNLTRLGAKSFLNLKSLRELTISGNSLVELNPRIFTDLVNLEQLCLSDNELENIVCEFPYLENLVTLDLAFNKLACLDVKVFSNLKHIKYLELGNNVLSMLQSGIFDCLINLEELSLTTNILTKLDNGLFSKLANLSTLLLYSNELSELDGSIFENLKKIETINLANNKLTALNPQLFSNVEKLNFLDLKNNRLSSIDFHLFSSIKSLRRLKISKS